MNKKVWLIVFLIFALALCDAMPAVAAAEQHVTNSIGMEFVRIPAGSFPITGGKSGNSRAIISKDFYLGKYEVTQEQWQKMMGNNPSEFKDPARPVEHASWYDVQKFIKRLNAREKPRRYRLPTEMEWELAARGGTDSKFFFMQDLQKWEAAEEVKDAAPYREMWGEAETLLSEYAWFYENSNHTTHPVGQKKPNPFGLYDIYGNVWEWIQDWKADLPSKRELRDYRGPSTGLARVVRGGSIDGHARHCQSNFRHLHTPNYWLSPCPGDQDTYIGFRLAFSPE